MAITFIKGRIDAMAKLSSQLTHTCFTSGLYEEHLRVTENSDHLFCKGGNSLLLRLGYLL